MTILFIDSLLTEKDLLYRSILNMISLAINSFLVAIFTLTFISNVRAFKEEEVEVIAKLKEKINIVSDPPTAFEEYATHWLERNPEAFLLNFISSAGGDVELAEKELRKTLEWRRLNNIDGLVKWEPPKGFKEMLKYNVTGFADDGTPVLYVPLGSWDLRSIIIKGQRKDLIRYFIQMIEVTLASLEGKVNNETKDKVGKFLLVINMDGFPITQISSIRVLSAIGAVMGIYDHNYPYYPKKAIIVNAPRYFNVIVDILRQIISERNMKLLQVFGRDMKSWKDALSQFAHSSVIPKEIGGDFVL